MFLENYLPKMNSVDENATGPMLDEAGLLNVVLEAETTFSDYTLAFSIAEHESIVSENVQILQEAAADWIEKIKKFFAKLWKGIVNFAKWVWEQIRSVFMKRDAWVKRNKNSILNGAKKAAASKHDWKIRYASGIFHSKRNIRSTVSLHSLRMNMAGGFVTNKNIEELQTAIKYQKEEIIPNPMTLKRKFIESHVKEAIDFIETVDIKGFKKKVDDVTKHIITARDLAIKDAKLKKDVAAVENRRKVAVLSIRLTQGEYKVMSRLYSYAYGICKRAFARVLTSDLAKPIKN